MCPLDRSLVKVEVAEMDERRIDAIVRLLDVIRTRRGTLRALLAGVTSIAIISERRAMAASSTSTARCH
jgi:hypothetical protein